MYATIPRTSAAGLLAAALAVTPLHAQQPPPGTATPNAPGRAPVIAIVQPPAGGSVPQDRPIVMFRVAPSDASDPIDARSFAVSVNGDDRSAGFQLAGSEAWGSLAAPSDNGTLTITPGVHRVAARICSSRGACTEVVESITVVASEAATSAAPVDRKRSMLDLLLLALRKLIEP